MIQEFVDIYIIKQDKNTKYENHLDMIFFVILSCFLKNMIQLLIVFA